MSDHDRERATTESEPTDGTDAEAEVAEDIDDSAPEELDAIVDALPGSGKLTTSLDDLDDSAGGPMQLP